MSATAPTGDLLAVPERRHAPLREVREALLGASHVALTTHVNADGDGTGSQAAVAAWLAGRGIRCTIVNPTPFPAPYRFVLPPGAEVADWGEAAAREALGSAEVLLVLDTGEPHRIGPIAEAFPRERMLVVDHHPEGTEVVAPRGLLDPTAAATGELVYDLLRLDGEPVPGDALLGIYVALVTDTGSFRYGNTSPRTHALAAHLLDRGIDPEQVYQRLFATVPRRRVELLREALARLHNEPDIGLSWIEVPHSVIGRLEATGEDLDGLVEYARSLEGTEVALLFRETPQGETKVSFRSNGRVDVNTIARQFSGGGHVKASGALIAGNPGEVLPAVLAAVRERLRDAG